MPKVLMTTGKASNNSNNKATEQQIDNGTSNTKVQKSSECCPLLQNNFPNPITATASKCHRQFKDDEKALKSRCCLNLQCAFVQGMCAAGYYNFSTSAPACGQFAPESRRIHYITLANRNGSVGRMAPRYTQSMLLLLCLPFVAAFQLFSFSTLSKFFDLFSFVCCWCIFAHTPL